MNKELRPNNGSYEERNSVYNMTSSTMLSDMQEGHVTCYHRHFRTDFYLNPPYYRKNNTFGNTVGVIILSLVCFYAALIYYQIRLK